MPAIAQLTLAAIEAALVADQGDRYRGLLRKNMARLDDAYADDQNASRGFRTHLGASLVGKKCARSSWYSFRWAVSTPLSGRMLRLFNRGHLEEGRLVSLLELIGCNVYQFSATGEQFRFSAHGGHYGGGLDCVIVGLPEMPMIPVLGEFKTHGEKSFTKLKADGLIASKFEHFAQMQQYMGAYHLAHGLYVATNKNTDELYAEVVNYNHELFVSLLEKGAQLVYSPTPPRKISSKKNWYECLYCDFKGVCHENASPDLNCRTCAHAVPLNTGKWHCTKHKIDLLKETQLRGCASYEENRNFR